MTTQVQNTAGKNLMASTWTKAAKVRRAFKAGRQRQKDLVLTPTRAILEGSLVLNSIQDAMREVALPEDDVKAGLVLVSDDAFYATLIPQIAGIPATLHKILSLEGVWKPLGLVLCQLDRDAGKSVTWVQPWLVDAASTKALIAAATAIASGKYGKQSLN